MGMAAILVNDCDHFSNPLVPQPKEAPYEIWAKLAQWLQRRSRLKMLTDRRTHARTAKKCFNKDDKNHDSRIRGLFCSFNHEWRGVAEAETTYVDSSEFMLHNENSDDIWSTCTYSLTCGLCYVMRVRRYTLLLIFAMNMHINIFSIFEVYDLSLDITAILYQRIKWAQLKCFFHR